MPLGWYALVTRFDASAHVPPTQFDAALQTFPHAPQLAWFVFVFTSHPSNGSPLQSRKPGLHAPTVHVPPLHAGVLFPTLHALPHPPQLFGSVPVLSSQPSAGFPLQSPKPALHVPTVHVPPLQPGVSFCTGHDLPHPPQLAGSAFVLSSQPSWGLPLQSPNPVLHVPTVHAPPLQPGVSFCTGHERPHPPQLPGSVFVLTSQPSCGLPLQSPNPVLHIPTVHIPPPHAGTSLNAGHVLPHPPQFPGSAPVFTSQPSIALLLQSVKPALHVPTVQLPPLHPGTSFSAGPASRHPPQFPGSALVFTSQPSIALPLQSTKPVLHAATVQLPPPHP